MHVPVMKKYFLRLESPFCINFYRPYVFMLAQSLSHVQLFATPWTVVARLCPGNSPGKNTRVSSHSLLKGIAQLRDQTQVS